MLAMGKMNPESTNVGRSEMSNPMRNASACESTSVDTSSPVPRAPMRKRETANSSRSHEPRTGRSKSSMDAVMIRNAEASEMKK